MSVRPVYPLRHVAWFALGALFLIFGCLPAKAGHWQPSYQASGTVTLKGTTYPWPNINLGAPDSFRLAGSGPVNNDVNGADGSGSGSVTATLTWVNDGQGPVDPPSRFVVRETIQLMASGDGVGTATFDDGFGDPTAGGPGLRSCGGSHDMVVDNPGQSQSVTLPTRMVSGSGSLPDDRAGPVTVSGQIFYGVVILPVPAAPIGLTAVPVSGTQINLMWASGDGSQTSYAIQRRTTDGTFGPMTVVPGTDTSFQDVGLMPNTSYCYQIQAINASGVGPFSDEACAMTQPNAPVNLTATPQPLGGVSLSWQDADTGLTGFKIERKTSTGGYSALATAGGSSAAFVDAAADPDTNYSYRVSALNDSGASDPSNEASALTYPAAPANATATGVSTSEIDVTWTDTNNTADWQLFRRVPGGTYPSTPTAVIPRAAGAAYHDTGLQPASAYVYQILAVNATGSSPPSNEAGAATVPAPPTNLTAMLFAGGQSVLLSWTNPPGLLTGIQIERKTGSGDYGPPTTVAPNSAQFLDATVAPNTTYTFRVRAVSAGGVSAPSNEATITTPPAGPTNLQATPLSATQIKLTWDDSNTAGDWQVFRRTGNGAYGAAPLATVTRNSGTGYTDAGLTANTSYTYKVVTVLAGLSSPPSNEAAATTPPLPPTNLTAMLFAGGQSVLLSWTNPPGPLTGIQVERRTGAGNYGPPTTVAPNSTQFLDATVDPNTTYTFRVRAVAAGGVSDPSNEATITTPPGAPTNLKAMPLTATQIKLTWDDSNTAGDWQVFRRTGNGAYGAAPLATVTRNSGTGYTDTGLTANTSYTYKVVTVLAGLSSPPSNEATGLTYPKAPVNLKAANGFVQTAADTFDLTINLDWEDTQGVTKWVVERMPRSADNPGFGPLLNVTTNNNGTHPTVRDTGLTEDTMYSYRVRAVNATGQSDPSNVASATTRLGPITNLTATAVTSKSVVLTWTDARVNVTGWRILKLVGGAYRQIATVAQATGAVYTDNSAAPGTLYKYRVRAYNANGPAPWSNIATATTPANVVVFDPGGAITAPTAIPWVHANVGVSRGEQVLFNIVGADVDRRRPAGMNILWTNFQGTGPYQIVMKCTANAEFDAAGSGTVMKMFNGLVTGNVSMFVKNNWNQMDPITVTATIKDMAPNTVAGPNTGSVKDADLVITWGFVRRVHVPTSMAQSAPVAINQWYASPAVYSYLMNPGPGMGEMRPLYQNESVLETFGAVTAFNFTLAALTNAWKMAHPTITTPDAVAVFLWTGSNNGTFVIDANDNIHDQHGGFGAVTPFTAAARMAGFGYHLPQTYRVAGAAIGNYNIDRWYNGAISIRKSGP